MSDHKGAAMLLPGLSPAQEPLADRGYDTRYDRGAQALLLGQLHRSYRRVLAGIVSPEPGLRGEQYKSVT